MSEEQKNIEDYFLDSVKATEKEKGLVLELKGIVEAQGEPMDELAKQYLTYKAYYQILFTNKWDMQKSNDAIMQILRWRRNYRPDEMCLERLDFVYRVKKPLIYLSGRDNEGRPFVWVDLCNALKEIKNDEDGMKKFNLLVYCAEVLQNIIKKSPGGVFSGSIVIQGKGIGIKTLKECEKFGTKFFKIVKYYQNCLHRAYLVNAGLFLRGAWMIGKKFWDPNLVEKYEVLSSEKNIQNFAPKEQVVKYFGGSSPYDYRPETIVPELPMRITNPWGYYASWYQVYDDDHLQYQIDNELYNTCFACRNSKDRNNWFQMNLYENTVVKGIILQARKNQDQWVNKLQIDVCDSNGRWTKLGNFPGVNGRDEKREILFKKPMECCKIRISKFQFNNHASFRVGYIK